jgi:uncharacterized RDD family membrane protein YckC
MDGEVKYAGFWPRFAALLLDGIVIIVAFSIFQVFMLGNMVTPLEWSEAAGTMDNVPRFLMSIAVTIKPTVVSNSIFMLAVIFYWVFLTWKFGGTLGKMAVGIKVVREDLKPISFGGAIVREFLVKQVFYLSIIFISWLGYLWVSWDKKKQGWHDKIARTLVIEETGVPEPVMMAKPEEPVAPILPSEPLIKAESPETIKPVEVPEPAEPEILIEPIKSVEQAKSDGVSLKVNLLGTEESRKTSD